MRCVKDIFKSEIEVKRSKFISFLVPYSKFKSVHLELKVEHKKANHIVWAYRYLNEYNQIVENSSDDGEPKGAAGVPTLSQLRGANLIESAILTVRYFGGIKLGVGGMVRAYSQSAKEVIDSARLIEFKKLESFEICVPYNRQREIEYHLKLLKIDSINREFLSDKVCFNIVTTKENIQKLKELMV